MADLFELSNTILPIVKVHLHNNVILMTCFVNCKSVIHTWIIYLSFELAR